MIQFTIITLPACEDSECAYRTFDFSRELVGADQTKVKLALTRHINCNADLSKVICTWLATAAAGDIFNDGRGNLIVAGAQDVKQTISVVNTVTRTVTDYEVTRLDGDAKKQKKGKKR